MSVPKYKKEARFYQNYNGPATLLFIKVLNTQACGFFSEEGKRVINH
jgi:hypothetical protein